MSKQRAGRENRAHIGIFGRCNAGKSTLLNFIVGAETAIVAPQRGTTTDVVRKSHEILNFAPVMFIDTAGVDDSSDVGRQRVERTLETIYQVDLALLIFREWGEPEQMLLRRFKKSSLPYLLIYNRVGEASLASSSPEHDGALGRATLLGDGTYRVVLSEDCSDIVVEVDAKRGDKKQHDRLMEAIKRALPKGAYSQISMFGDRVGEGDLVILVCPIDEAAPKGRLILPQVQALRELLDRHALGLVVQVEELEGVLEHNLRPKLIVTDSQVFQQVGKIVPPEIELTSFSILLAAAKGDYHQYRDGLKAVDTLKDGDKILIAENCSHQISCEDIGRVKIPRWLEEYSGAKLKTDIVTGLNPLPDDLESYALMVQCGGCMVTRSQLQNRIRRAVEARVPITNYGMLIKKLTLKR